MTIIRSCGLRQRDSVESPGLVAYVDLSGCAGCAGPQPPISKMLSFEVNLI